MRILHIDTEKGFRGGEQQLLWLVEGLKNRGIYSKVGCLNNGKLHQYCLKKNLDVLPLSGNILFDIIKLSKESKNFDIIHAHAAKAHLVSAFTKSIVKKPLIYTRRIDYIPKKDPITRFKYRSCDAIVAVSNAVKETIRFLSKNTKIYTIHSSTDPELEKKISTEKVEKIKTQFKNKIIIGTACALTKQKNIPNLIKAAKIVLDKLENVVFVVAGEGELKNKIEKIIKKENLQENFFLIGFKHDIHNYIKAFDIFVMPSDNEGLSGAMLTAMVLGKPIISTNAGGAREAIIDKKTGLLVEKNQSEQLANAIINIINDKNLKEKLEKNAKEFAKKTFSINNMVEKYIKVYNELTEGKNAISKS